MSAQIFSHPAAVSASSWESSFCATTNTGWLPVAGGDGVAAAYRLLDARGLHPYMDVRLRFALDGRFTVEPLAMWSEPDNLDVSRRVDDILVDSGRPRDALRREEAQWFS
ncbi:hypothetical protein ABZ894_14785 [Nocardia beijingensis]|uniref:hypothetical protein n=1 Tax=Nocardia beijingensis TaxID=95162 RepID=UPI0033D98616